MDQSPAKEQHRSVVGSLVAANDAYAGSHDGSRPVHPRRRLVVVACMDSRMDIFSMLGLEVGDAHVIRNAGGLVVDDVIRSICFSQRVLGTREIVLIHHTNCGLEGISDDEFSRSLEGETGFVPTWRVGGFDDAATDVQRAIQSLRDSPFIPHRDQISGFVFDVESGRLEPVA